ncbi:Ig-like domain-containing protein [Anaerostipes caccae]|uniref:Ig-like domain-containing protein n=1 Tax=Anaerostipes caccae TaxID=105841 RepID=UPI0038D370E0
MKKRILILITSFVLVLTPMYSFTSICNMKEVHAAKKKPKLSKKKIVLIRKEKYRLKMLHTKKKVKWSSNDSYVAKVSKKGVVTAKAEGTAKITAKIGKKKYKCTVKVEDPYIGTVDGETYVEVGRTLRYYMCNTTYKKYKWKSSNTAVATIDNRGIATGRKIGKSTIYTYIKGKKLTNVVHVVKPSIKRFVNISALNHDCYGNATLKVQNKGTKILKMDATGFIYDGWDSAFIYTSNFDDDCTDYKYIVVKPGQTKTLDYSSTHSTWYLNTANFSFNFYYGNDFHSYSINVNGSNESLN